MTSLARYLRLALAAWFFSIPCGAQNAEEPVTGESESEKLLLERLMASESGGRQFAKNPRSSALGPFQFVKGTFLDIMRRRMSTLTAGKSDEEICRLRVDPEVSRKAALIYVRETTKFFAARNVAATPANLRLAFFVGQTGAVRVLAAKPDSPLSSLLSPSALGANPGLRALSAGQLIDRSTQDVAGTSAQAESPEPSPIIAGGQTVQTAQHSTATPGVAGPPDTWQLIDRSTQDVAGISARAESPEPGPVIAGGQIVQTAQHSTATPGVAGPPDTQPSEGEFVGRKAEASEIAVAGRQLASVGASMPGGMVHEHIESAVPLLERPPALESAARCNPKLASCRKWLALAERRSQIAQAAVPH